LSHPVPSPRRSARLRARPGRDAPLRFGWVLLFLVSCAAEVPERPAFVAASVAPVGSLVAMVAGPGVPVEVFLPANQTAHDFEPTPGDALRLAGARLVVSVDPHFDPWMVRAVRAVAGPDVPVLTLSSASKGPGDPHAWMDPPTVIAFLPELAQGLAAAFPERAGEIRERAATVEQALRGADDACAGILEPVADEPFVLQLPAFVNFAERYGLRLIGVIQTCPEEEPTPGAFARSAAALRAGGGHVVFASRGVTRATADALALEVGGRVAVLDPFGVGEADLAGLWTAGATRMAEALSDARD